MLAEEKGNLPRDRRFSLAAALPWPRRVGTRRASLRGSNAKRWRSIRSRPPHRAAVKEEESPRGARHAQGHRAVAQGGQLCRSQAMAHRTLGDSQAPGSRPLEVVAVQYH